MTLVLAVIFLGIGGIIFSVVRRLANPAVLLFLVWGVVCLLIYLGAALGYSPVAVEAWPAFLGGALAFAVGSLSTGRQQLALSLERLNFRPLIRCCWIAHVVFLPLWWRDISKIVADPTDLPQLAFALRVATASEGETLGFLAGNYLVVGLILMPFLMLGWIQRRLGGWETFLVTLPWLITNFLTNGRAPLVGLAFTMLYLYAHQARISGKAVLVALLLFVTVFSAGAILVKKSGIDDDSSPSEVATAVVRNFLDYLIQGPILYSNLVAHNSHAAHDWDSLALLKGKPLEHGEYNAFNEDGDIGNVYTIYFAQVPIYGFAGMLGLMFIYGLLAGYLYRNSWRSYFHAILAAYFFGAVILTVFSDIFGPGLNFLAKTAIVISFLQFILKPSGSTAK